MAEIPLDKDYLRKHYPDKYKELEKNKASSHTSQSKNKSTQKQPILPSIEDSRVKSFMEQIPDLTGGIEWPTEFDKFICEGPSTPEEFIISQPAWLAKASAHAAMYLKKCIEENPKKEHAIEDWYRIISSPFTNRIKPITPTCEGILDVLPSVLPNFEQRFREVYGKMLSVAKKADEDKAHTLGAGIRNFKLASLNLYNTTMQIHSEAIIRLGKLTKPASSGKTGDTKPTDKNKNPRKIFGMSTLFNLIPPVFRG